MNAGTGPPLDPPWWRRALTVGQAVFAPVVQLVLLVFLYVVLLSALVTILNIVSPPLVQEPGIVLFVAAIAAGVVILPRILFSAFFQRLNAFPGYSVDPLYADAALKPMILNLRVRSRLYKVGAVTAFLFIAVATLVGFTVVHTAVEQNPLSASEPSDTLVGVQW